MNIAEILRHCSKGTKLYSTVFGEVTLDKVDIHDMYPIVVCRFNHLKTSFDKEGHYLEDYPGAECVLFPSKEQRDWEKFRIPFKAGDIAMTVDGETPFIFKEYIENKYAHCYCGIDANGTFKIEAPVDVYWTSKLIIPASEEAKKELFDKIEEAGYKWNADTLELEEAAPKFKSKFKPFDKVLVRNNPSDLWHADIYLGYFEGRSFPYRCATSYYKTCIPYEGNEHLVVKQLILKKYKYEQTTSKRNFTYYRSICSR